MYTIRIGDNDLYYPGDKECVVSGAKYKEEIGAAGSLEITLPKINPYYENISLRSTELKLYKDDELVFNGEVREITEDFYKNKTVYAVDELSYFNDSIQTLQKLTGTKTQVFNTLISSHNAQVDSRKQFTVGTIYGGSESTEIITEYESTMTALLKLAGDDLYLRIRRQGGSRYIDLMPLETYGRRSEQYIEFKKNIIDYASITDSDGLATACIPLGVSLDTSPVEDSTAYLDIKSVNGGIDYVYNRNAVDNYGWIKRVVHFNVLDTPEALKTAGENWLSQNQFEKYSYTISAVDMPDEDDYRVGDYIRCISDPHGMDAWLPVRSRETDLLNPANNKITVGADGVKTLTQQNTEAIAQLKDEMPVESDILKTALKNASNLINANGNNGYVSIRTDANNKPYEIIIMNAPSIEQATHGWRWNLSGFGHGTKAAGASEFTWETNVAITMDGSIVANYITSGILKGIEIDNGSGTFHVDSSGNMTATSGTFGGNLNAAGGTFKGDLSAAGGTFKGSLNAASGGGVANISGGSFYMKNSNSDGPGVFASTTDDSLYACWGAKNSAAKTSGAYLETATMNIIQAGANVSDRKLKHNIGDLSVDLSKQIINGIKTRKFNYNNEPFGERECFGFIAQEVQDLYDDIGLDKNKSDLVYNNGDLNYLSVNYKNLIAPLINYVRDLQQQINEMKGETND